MLRLFGFQHRGWCYKPLVFVFVDFCFWFCNYPSAIEYPSVYSRIYR